MNNRMLHCNRILALSGLILLLAASCRPFRNLAEEETPALKDSDYRLISILEKRTHNFRTMKARRVDVEFYVNGIREQVRGNIAIYRDSLIAVSLIPAMGYEFLRILCTTDSVIIINRPDKSYAASSFEYYRKKYGIPVGFSDIQAMLANEVFYYKEGYSDRVYEKQLNTRKENSLFIVDAFREGQQITNQGIEIDSEGRRLENIFVLDYDTKMRLNLDYEDFGGTEEILFPRRILVDLVESNNTIQMDIHYGQIIFNDSINVDFSVPSHYTRGDI